MKNNQSYTTENAPIKPNEKDAGIFYTATVLSLVALSFMAGAIIQMFTGENSVADTNWYKILNFFLTGIALFVASIIATRISGISFKKVALKLPHLSSLLVCALVLYGMMTGLSEANNLIVRLFEKMGYFPYETVLPDLSPLNFILCTISICLLPAVFEEYIFRGGILNGLKVFGEVKAIIISALLFAFYHMAFDKTLYQFLVGLIFGFIAVRYKSIIPTIIIHFLNNFIIVVNHYFWGLNPTGGAKVVLIITGLLALVTAFFIMTVNKFALEKGESRGSFKEFFIYSAAGIFAVAVLWLNSIFAFG